MTSKELAIWMCHYWAKYIFRRRGECPSVYWYLLLAKEIEGESK